MKYEFRAEDGRALELEFAPADVPDDLVVDGVTYKAQFGPTPSVGAPSAIVRDDRHLCHTLERKWQSKEMASLWDKWTENGTAYCEGKRDRQELHARMKAHPKYAHFTWNEGD